MTTPTPLRFGLTPTIWVLILAMLLMLIVGLAIYVATPPRAGG